MMLLHRALLEQARLLELPVRLSTCTAADSALPAQPELQSNAVNRQHTRRQGLYNRGMVIIVQLLLRCFVAVTAASYACMDEYKL